MRTDVVIVGAGPAGIFTALEMIRKGSGKKIVICEKGAAIENRRCPKAQTKRCVNCKPYCHITTGFSGAGAFSDGKLSLSCEVGGDLPSLIGEDVAQETIDYADGVYLEFGADPHVEGVGNPEEVKRIRARAIQAGLKLVDCPIRHLGTEKAQQIYYAIEQYLIEHGVELRFGCECRDLIPEGRRVRGRAGDRGRRGARNLRRQHRGGDGAARRGLAGEPLRRAQHRPSAGHGGHRRARRVPQRDHGARQRGALRVQADRLPEAVQEQGAHVLPEPRRIRQSGELRQPSGRRQRPIPTRTSNRTTRTFRSCARTISPCRSTSRSPTRRRSAS